MTPEEAIELLKGMQSPLEDYAELVGAPAFAYGHKYAYPYPQDYAIEEAIEALKEIQQYREIGTVEQVKNQKENLNVAYQIISDYEQYGTVEEFKMAQRYMRLVNAHGTIGQVIDSCAEYEEIGTVDECREALEKQIPKAPIMKSYYEDMPNEEYLCCPTCGDILTDRIPGDNKNFYFHCLNCGQKFDWGEKDD